MKNVRFVGLDVHAKTIGAAVAESSGEVRSLGVIPNRAESVARLVRKLGKPESLRFEQHAQELTLSDYLHEVEHAAERIVRLERSIDAAIESLPVKMRAVIQALQSLRGIAQISAVSIMAEVGQLSRFAHPRQLMGYSGAVCREHSSGPRIRRGPISKADNAHLRRIAVEAAWAYRHSPAIGKTLAARQRRSTAAIIALAWKAQQRLHRRYARLIARGKNKQQTVTAVARELLGFIWAIGVQVEREGALGLPLAA